MKPRELISLLEKEGFVFVRQSGSHAIYRKAGFKLLLFRSTARIFLRVP
ncbi:MAG: type II toxin-antitoxin system HicA family toxin [Cyclobacteriaceae bacterium]|nr:type II toxin-antitoxin system HicA family toxin [Cyclobacteriaceae bacterium]